MSIDIDVTAKILAPLITAFVVGTVRYFLEGRVRIVSYLGHTSTNKSRGDKPFDVHTHNVIVHNTGRKAAHNLRIGHNLLPESVTVVPTSIQYTVERNPDGGAEIVFPTLVPKEQITISYLYFPPVIWSQINSYVKADEGYAKIIKTIPFASPSLLVKVIVWALMSLGLSLIIYWLVHLAAYLLQ
ncbi:hypothetical protein [Glaciimonas soli]|uniref:Uncharacterized protein n=1 Tax=Glaciimonas soli TaxID=2590999 RepID=A0A843YYN3_9BURK|nr:hypothetical protein [Glaciimonas soli]MQR02371.1 hypothetical protein [Glaciimonas soli]